MVSVSLQAAKGGRTVPLGTACTFEIQATGAETWSAFVRYEGILYPSAVAAEQRGPGQVVFFPECPGDYELQVIWTGEAGGRGIARAPFTIQAGTAVSLSPTRERVDGQFHVWAPTGRDGCTSARGAGRGATHREARRTTSAPISASTRCHS